MESKYKKLIFIDNDNLGIAKEDVYYVKNILDIHNGFSESYVNSISIIPDFYHLKRDEQFEVLIQESIIVCTYSMYTVTHHGSLFQLISSLTGVGRYDIQDKVFLDGSGQLLKSMKYALDHCKDIIYMLRGIENNYILSVDKDDDYKIKRLKVKLSGTDYGFFELVDVDLEPIFSK